MLADAMITARIAEMILDFFKRKKKSVTSPPPDPHERIHPNQLGDVGQYGEDKAAEYLFLHGYKIIEIVYVQDSDTRLLLEESAERSSL